MARLFKFSLHGHFDNGVVTSNTISVVARPPTGRDVEATASEVATALTSAWFTVYRNAVPNTWHSDGNVCREILPPGSTDVPEEAAVASSLAGLITTSGDQLPTPICTLLTLYTNAAVRSGHGRIFLPNPGNASLLAATGVWDSTTSYWTTALVNLAAAIVAGTTYPVTAYPDGNISAVIYSKARHEANLDQYYFDVNGYNRRAAPHWLRSRMTSP